MYFNGYILNLLITKGMQMKTTIRYHSTIINTSLKTKDTARKDLKKSHLLS